MDEINIFIEAESHGHADCPVCAEREKNTRLARCNMQMQQQIGNTFCPETGLRNGTIFPDLFMPYEPGWRNKA